MTRAASAKKRPASADILPSQPSPSLKKRPSLADITNFTAAASVVVDDGKFRKRIRIGRNDQKPIAIEEPAHSDDPQMCTAYADDIYQYLHSMEIENKRRPRPDYIEKVQADVTPQMRGVLVDWLVEVAGEYKLLPDTLYLAVNYLDRFLSSNVLARQKLQLLGVSCMLIASKFEEITPPNVEDFSYITDHTYTEQQVVKMESDILNALKFEVSILLQRLSSGGSQELHKEILILPTCIWSSWDVTLQN